MDKHKLIEICITQRYEAHKRFNSCVGIAILLNLNTYQNLVKMLTCTGHSGVESEPDVHTFKLMGFDISWSPLVTESDEYIVGRISNN